MGVVVEIGLQINGSTKSGVCLTAYIVERNVECGGLAQIPETVFGCWLFRNHCQGITASAAEVGCGIGIGQLDSEGLIGFTLTINTRTGKEAEAISQLTVHVHFLVRVDIGQ